MKLIRYLEIAGTPLTATKVVLNCKFPGISINKTSHKRETKRAGKECRNPEYRNIQRLIKID
eukprot:snap_masked-scaffold_24-processed-gene-5.10-mRNA-1 protein AED:1.00 eAED:1.00 QI:0/-1/0/0/-1/1/1/0/61